MEEVFLFKRLKDRAKEANAKIPLKINIEENVSCAMYPHINEAIMVPKPLTI